MSAERRTLVVTVPIVWGLRNVLRSGLAELLRPRFDLLFAAPPAGCAMLRREGIPAHDLLVLPEPARTRGHDRLMRVLRRAHRLRRSTESDGIFRAWRGGPATLRDRVAHHVEGVAGALAAPAPLFRRLERAERASFARLVPPSLTTALAVRRPVAALSTSCVEHGERPVVHALQALGVPTVAHVLSFDNLTSRGYVPLAGFDRYLVWNDRMAEELSHRFGVAPARITITGTPQFDFHVAPGLAWPREETAAELGLDGGQPYVVYGANHAAITPSEPALVAALLEAAAADPSLAGHAWVLRLHPLDDYARWDDLARRFPAVRVSRPWRHDAEGAWGLPDACDVALLGNTLRHAAAVLCVASTLALDAAVVDTPVVCVGFHPTAGPREQRFCLDAHYTDHFRPIAESGAAPVATDMSSCLHLLRDAVARRSAGRAARARLVATMCGPVDGRAAARIAAAVTAAADGEAP